MPEKRHDHRRGCELQIHHQRAEKPNLERLMDRVRFTTRIEHAEQTAVSSLWRSARHQSANSSLSASIGPSLITSGWAGWLRYGKGGRRQIFLFLMPGDFIVPGLFTPEACDLVSLTPLRTVDARPLIQTASTFTPSTGALLADSGRYYRLLLLDHLTRLTSGCTTSAVAHLLAEFHLRSMRSGAFANGRFSMPIGQRVIASALGRSTVQINKIIQQFQADGLLTVGYDWIGLRDKKRLCELAGMSHTAFGARHSASTNEHEEALRPEIMDMALFG